MKGLYAAAAMAAVTSANSVPIMGQYPGWLEGEGKLGIQIELYEDYLCSDCKAFNPIFEQVLDTEWEGATVRDQVTVGITPFPLPYHVHTY